MGPRRRDLRVQCRKGNCTDFHSLFIAIARSRGIPARFTIGFPLGTAASGKIPGYHCWAEFYSGGEWVPVDASEAWKHPQRRKYYFGHLDAARVAFTMGRDLVLKPPQHGEPLNFLIYPYAEMTDQRCRRRKSGRSFLTWTPARDAATRSLEHRELGVLVDVHFHRAGAGADDATRD